MGGKVSGTVKDSVGNPIQTTVRVWIWNGGDLLGSATSSSSDGSYTIGPFIFSGDVLVTSEMGSNNRPLSHGPVTPTSATGSIKYDFEDGTLQGWIDDAGALLSATTNRAKNGSYALEGTANGQPENIGHVSPSELAGGIQIATLEFWYQETSGSEGALLGAEDSNGTLIVAAGTDNPEYALYDNSGTFGQGNGPNSIYDVWVFVKIDFDWVNGQYTATFDADDGTATASHTGTLVSNTDVETLRIKNIKRTSDGFGSGDYHHWLDDIVVTG